ncbi:MAG: type II secretion system secretin GspD [Gammaproteobacteria bacterium]|nr:type II secretion system secretin GspD [Gammaproteobacteria bacterium]
MLMAALLLPFQVRAQDVTLNLKDADIGAVIATVSDVTGKNFIVDPRVKAKVTVISAKPMNKDEIYQVFLSLLEVNGFAAVPMGKVIKIIPDVNAKQVSTPLANNDRPGRGDEYVTRVIHVNNVSAAQLVPVLRPLAPQQAHMVAYPGTNALIVSDRAANVERLAKIIQDIDQPGNETEVEVMPLKHAAASEVARTLTSLDQEARKSDPSAAVGITDRPVLIPDERTNSILMGGGKSGRLRMRALVSHLDTPLENSGNIRVIYLHYAKAKDLVPVLTGVASQVQDKGKVAGGAAPGGATGGGPPGSGINIQADESLNALVVTAPPDVFRSLQMVISQLDVRRAQVLVEAVIAEVNSSRAAELGVQWATFDRTQGSNAPVGLTNFTNGSAGSSIAEIGGAIATNRAPSLGPGMTFGLGRFISEGFSFAALIRALESDGSSNVLSTPTLVVLDNSDGEITVGQNVPFITGAFAAPVAGAGATPVNPFQTIQRQNVGITLKVKPQINEGNSIQLNIEQKVDSLSTSAVRGAADLITNTRSIKTSVMVDDGKVVVLGGLITDDLKENVQKVPFLGDLPLVGSLFRYKRNTKDKTNLMVFLHPVIMRDGELAERMTSGKYNFIRTQQLEARLKDRGLLRNEALPLMPPMQDMMKLPPPFEPGTNSPPTDKPPANAGPSDGRSN